MKNDNEKLFRAIKNKTIKGLYFLKQPARYYDDQMRSYGVQDGNVRQLKDFFWYLFNKSLSEYHTDFHIQSQIYMAMAWFRHDFENGKGVFELKKQAINAKLLEHSVVQTGGIIQDVVVIGHKDSCACCSKDNGTTYSVEQFRQLEILPHRDCTCSDFGCICWIGSKARRDANGDLIWESSSPTKRKGVSTQNQNMREGAKTILSILNLFKKNR